MTWVYKIVLNEDRKLKTLFKAIEGSRTLMRGKWLKADVKIGTDGSGGRRYLTGIHCFKDIEKAYEYLQRFPTSKPRIVIGCEAMGLRRKPSNPNVWLANRIKIPTLA